MPGYWDGVETPTKANVDSDSIVTDPTVPPGFYVAEVEEWGAWCSKKDDIWKARWTLRIIEGMHTGKYLVRWTSMVDDQKQRNLELFTLTLGHPPEFDGDHGFADFSAVRAGIVGSVVKVKTSFWKTRSGDQRTNVYINQTVAFANSGAGSATPEVPAATDSDDEIPF